MTICADHFSSPLFQVQYLASRNVSLQVAFDDIQAKASSQQKILEAYDIAGTEPAFLPEAACLAYLNEDHYREPQRQISKIVNNRNALSGGIKYLESKLEESADPNIEVPAQKSSQSIPDHQCGDSSVLGTDTAYVVGDHRASRNDKFSDLSSDISQQRCRSPMSTPRGEYSSLYTCSLCA